MTRIGSAALLSVVLVGVVWSVLHLGWYTHNQIIDTPVYQAYADKMIHHDRIPYRDFHIEYPPAALPAFVVPALLERWDYQRMFGLEMAVCAAVVVFAVLLIAGRGAAVYAALAPLALGSVVLTRFDFWPAALTVLALLALLRGRLAVSAILLGTGFAAKLWPALLAPFVLVWLWRTRGWRPALTWAGATVAAAAAWFLPFSVLAPAGVGHSFYAQFARPLQLESLGGAVLIALHHVAGTRLHVVNSFGSQNLVGTGVHPVTFASTAAGALALVLLWVAYARSERRDAERLLTACAGAVALAIAFGKVFSPQFLIWLIPLVPLVVRATPLTLFGCALVLTQLWFPTRYWSLALHFSDLESWELLARDLIVVALGVILAWPPLEHEVLGEHRARLEALQRVRTQVD